jgi:hypothetical protein
MADVTDTFYEGDAFHGYGSQFLVGQANTTPQTFVAVADVRVITPGDMTTAVIDKTHLRSPDAHREKLAGLRDSGAFTLEGNWRPDHGSQSNAGGDGFNAPGGLIYLWRTRAERDFQIVLSDGTPPTTWPFDGVITRFQPGAITVDDAVVGFTAEVTPLNGASHALLP